MVAWVNTIDSSLKVNRPKSALQLMFLPQLAMSIITISSPIRHNAAPTPTLHHIPHNMRMRNLATHAASRIRRFVRIVSRATAIAQLCHEAIDGRIISSVWVGAQQTGKMVDVAAGKAEKRECFCR